MAVERTLIIVKPNAVRGYLAGAVIAMLTDAGLRRIAQKRLQLTAADSARFYAAHRERPFFASLCAFMCSGPVEVLVLEAEDAVARSREIMGATDPAEAARGTIRQAYGETVERNSVHGSDSVAAAAREIAFFFREDELPAAGDGPAG